MTKKTWVYVVTVTLILASTSACRRSGYHGRMDVPITLKRGQSINFSPRPLEVTFLRVLEDSRCPLNVTCVRQGDAVIQLQGKSPDGGFDTFEARLPGGAAPMDTTIPWDVWAGYRFRLLRLDPYPRAGVPVDSSTYVATILVRVS